MVLIGTEDLLEQLAAIDDASVGVEQRDVVGVGAVGVRQQDVVRVAGHVIEPLTSPRVVDFGGKTVFSLRAGQMWVQRVLPEE